MNTIIKRVIKLSAQLDIKLDPLDSKIITENLKKVMEKIIGSQCCSTFKHVNKIQNEGYKRCRQADLFRGVREEQNGLTGFLKIFLQKMKCKFLEEKKAVSENIGVKSFKKEKQTDFNVPKEFSSCCQNSGCFSSSRWSIKQEIRKL